MRNRVLLLVSFCMLLFSVKAQEEVARYMFDGEHPVCLDELQKELDYPLAWGNSDIREFDLWRTAARNKLREEMLIPPKPAAEYNMKVVAEEKRKGYSARKLVFNLDAYSRVEAYELIPDGDGPFPAVVLLHDHGGHFSIGKEKMIRPFAVADSVVADADAWAVKCYDGQYVGDYLASKGYVVFAIDAPFWGDRGVKGGTSWDKYKYIAGDFMMLGRNISSWISFDDVYSVDFLATLPEVDSSRIGCMGFSMGGYRSWMLASLTDKVKVGVSICWMHTAEYQVNPVHGLTLHEEWCYIIPGIRRYLDYPHIASIACPKPMLFVNGSKDKLFPPISVNKAFSAMRKVWKDQNADDKLETEIWDMPHYCGPKVQERLLEFLDKHLQYNR